MQDLFDKLRTTRNCYVIGMFLVLMTIVPAAFGQGRAALSGAVTDSQGALVPSAVVTLTQTSTGAITVVNSNAGGLYVFPSLPAASYSISVSASGFKTFVQTGIALEADQSVTVNAILQLGETSQTVTVAANVTQVDTTTGTLSQVVGQQSVNDLPLNGRNAADLTEETAGVVLGPVDNSDQGLTKTFPAAVTVSVNGARSDNTNYMFDGGNNIDEYFGVNQPFPFPDALQEFSIQTSNYNAEYGQSSGGVVNIVSRSGGDQFHGSLFEFVRNGAFNAANYFSSTVDPLKRNQFGGTVGGPVAIPHLFESRHTFFFFGYQKTLIRDQQGGVNAFVPTQANLNGDFSALETANPDNPFSKPVQLINPFTEQPYAGDMIDPHTFDPAAVAVMKDLPSVTGNGSVYYQNPLIQGYNEFIVRGDQDLHSTDHISAHYYLNGFTNAGVLNTANLLTYAAQSHIQVQSALLSETHTFSPNLLNTLVVNYSREVSTRGPVPGGPNITDFGVNITQPSENALTGLAATGFFSLGASAEAAFQRNNYTLSDDVHWVKGSHSMAFGVHAELSKVDLNNQFNQPGNFTFNSQTTGCSTLANCNPLQPTCNPAQATCNQPSPGFALAGFLLGSLYNFSQGNGQYFNDRDQFYGFYAQDSWRATRKLVINYGLRYEPYKPWHEINHKVMQFNPDAYAAGRVSTVYVNAPPGMLFPGDSGVPEDGVRPNYKSFMPRVGFAYDVFGDGSLSVRGGGGSFYDTRQPAIFNSIPSEISPFSTSVALTDPKGTFSNPYAGITDPFPAPSVPSSTFVFPTPVQVNSYDPSGTFKVPVTYAYNLTIEKQLPKDMMARLAYVGARSSHMFVDSDINPANYDNGSTLGPDSRRHFPGYTDIHIASMSGSAAYNSLQATLQRHLSKGLSVTVNYTYSKGMDTLPYNTIDTTPSSGAGAPYAIPVYDQNYKSLDIGPSDFDRTHVFSGSYVWVFPKMIDGNGVVRAILNGWRTTGIVQAQSGQPLTVTAGSDVSGTALLADRAEWNGQRPYGTGACGARSPCKNYLNPADFSLPAPGTFGNVVKGSFRGPGYFDWDAGMFRSFGLGGERALEFRAEYFNVINRNNLNNPITSVGSAAFGSISTAAATESPIAPRIAQFSGKFIF